jgi:hypothetical protein
MASIINHIYKNKNIILDNNFIEDTRSSDNDNFLKINLNNADRIIKFRSLNKDQNFIFIKIKNTINIYDLIRFNIIYSFHLNEEIINFEISPLDSSVVLNTLKNLQIHSLDTNNLEDFNLKINYKLSIIKEYERIENLTISSLGDVIAILDSFHIIKILNRKLEVLKNIKHELRFFSNWPSSNFNLNVNPDYFLQNLNLHYFNFTYDTKNLCLCKFGENKISFLYKNLTFAETKNLKNGLESTFTQFNGFTNIISPNESFEYLENLNEFDNNIIYLKEMQKDLACYLENENSSIFFVLTEGLNFNIMRKIIQNDNNRPDLIILAYLDLSIYTDYLDYPNISFSLLYDNQNPIFNSNKNDFFSQFQRENGGLNPKTEDNDIRISSGILNHSIWRINNNNNLECEEGFFQTQTFYLKNLSTDYLFFNFYENIILYKIEGLNSYAYNNVNIETIGRVFPDEEYNNDFILIKFTKTLDRKYSVYFIDENNIIRKYYFKSDSLNRIHNTEKFLKIYSNIITVKYNEMNRKTLILEFKQNDSLIYLLNSKLEFTQLIIIKNILIENLKWVENSDFIIFNFYNNKIAIMNYFSKYINKRIIEFDENSLSEKFNLYNLPLEEANKIVDIKFNTNFIGILNKIIIKSNYANEIKFNFLAVTQNLEIFLVKVSIEENSSTLSNDTEFLINFSIIQSFNLSYNDLCVFEKEILEELKLKSSFTNNLSNNIYLNKKFQILRNNFIFTDKSLIYYNFDKKLKIFSLIEINSESNNKKKIIFQTLILNELIYANIFMNNYLIFITEEYLNSFDFSTFSFFRVRNDYLIKVPSISSQQASQNKYIEDLNKINIDLVKFGTFPYVFFTYSDEIKFVRIPRNKNLHEEFDLKFIYKEEVSLSNTKMVLKNDFILLNKSQIFKVFEITKKKQDIELEDERFLMLLINSNPISLFDLQTFLDFFLSGNEEIIKLILNMFCNIFFNIKDFEEKYTSSKLVPNFLIIENINYLYKIIFDNDLNILSMIGKETDYENNSNSKNGNQNLNSEESEGEDYGLGIPYGIVTNKDKSDSKKNSNKSIHEVNKTHNNVNKKNSDKSMDSINEIKDTVKKLNEIKNLNHVLEKKKTLIHSSSFRVGIRNSISIKIDNPKLQFIYEKDNQENNVINILANKNKNFLFLKNIYEIISHEATRNIDNFTKYMILKIKSKNKDLENNTFKFSTADLCWITFITDQENFINFLSKSNSKNPQSIIKWEFMKIFSVPLWIKNDLKLKELIETVAKNEIKEMNKIVYGKIDNLNKNIAENVALYYFLLGKKNIVIDLFDKELWNENVKKFIMRDFSIAKNRKIARENADDLLKKKKYLFASFFYLLADDLRGAVDMALLKLKDINLTVTILRLYKSPYPQTNKYTYSMEMLLQEYFINFGTAIRDPWLVVFGNIGIKRIDLALEYVLNYDCKYSYQNNKEIMENIEYFGDNIEIIRNIFGINTFDYKLLIFAKNLEKIYLKTFEEYQINVKSVQNTNFDDIWDFDDGANSNTTIQQTNDNKKDENEIQLKEININYENLSKLCLTNCLSRGILYAPIMNIYKSIFPKDKFHLDNTNRELLKNLFCERIVLDIIFLDENRVDYFFNDIEKFLDKLEENKILNKQEIFYEINKTLLWFDRYRSCAIPCKKSNKLTENLIRISQFTERLVTNNISNLIDFNILENLDIKQIKHHCLKKMKDISFFLKDLIEYEEKVDLDEKGKKSLPNIMYDKFDVFNNTLNCQIRTKQNLLIFRIIFTNFFYLIFCCKVNLSYHKILKIFNILNDLTHDYNNIYKFNEKAKRYLEIMIKYIDCISVMIQSTHFNKDANVFMYSQILNYSLISHLYEFIKKNILLMKFDYKKSLKTNALNPVIANTGLSVMAAKNKNEFNYVFERFKFIPFIMSYLNSYLENFDNNFDRYARKFISISFFAEIHEELKMIYMKDLKNEQNFFKFSLIPIKLLFKNEEKLKTFEEFFKIKENVIKYVRGIFKFIQYEKSNKLIAEDSFSKLPNFNEKENNLNNELNGDSNGINYVNSGYTPQSIKFIHEIFKSGIDVVNYGDSASIHGLTLNSCDPSNMVVALGIGGHRKINLLFNLLIRKRSEGKFFSSENYQF